MNALFVYSINDIYTERRPLRSPEQMQFGISYISSVLKQAGHSTSLAVLSRAMGANSRKVLEDEVLNFKPDVIFFTAVSTEYQFIVRTARDLRKSHPEVYMVLGGVHATLDPETAFDDTFDAICIGEGEYPSLQLLSRLAEGSVPRGIPGFWFRSGGTVVRNEPAPFLEEIDDLPHPDRDMWRRWCHEDKDAYYPVMLGRGCPFDCTYCCNHALRKVTKGKYVRMRSVASIIGEIRELATLYPERNKYYLEVETVSCDREWAARLFAELEKLNISMGGKLSFGTNMRVTPNFKPDDMFRAMARANFRFINIGLESGSERVRREILKRNYSNEDVRRVVECARKNGLGVNFYNLIGVPGETVDDFEMTLDVNRICQPDKTFPHIFYPYPGTELYNVCKSQGFLDKGLSSELERSLATLDLPGFSRKKIQEGHIWFRYNVYKGHRPALGLLTEAALAACLSNVRLRGIYRKLTLMMRGK